MLGFSLLIRQQLELCWIFNVAFPQMTKEISNSRLLMFPDKDIQKGSNE